MKKLLSLVIVLGLLIAATGCPSATTSKPATSSPPVDSKDKPK